MARAPKPLRFRVPSKSDLMGLPTDVIDEIGHLLNCLQHGDDANEPNIRRFGEDRRISHVVKIVSDGSDGNTYRCAATVEFSEGIWVIDVFAKKSTSGISTPKIDLDRIHHRLKSLEEYRKTAAGMADIEGMKNEYKQMRKNLGLPDSSNTPGTK